MYQAQENRYEQSNYRKCGNSGISLPEISLGLWQNFGGIDIFENYRAILRAAFDNGVCHFDLANNYGPPPGSAEENFGEILKKDFLPYRDELIISSKAGYLMWPGPYGEWGSRKYIIASCNQSLKRMGLEYVDIFYSHRPDPNTPIEETMGALDTLVKQGKTLYIGLSNYDSKQTAEALAILKQLGTPCLIHQPKYSMLVREPENGLLEVLDKNGVGCIPFSPLAQGLLTNKYLGGVPAGSRATRTYGSLRKDSLSTELLTKIQKLNTLAEARDQTLAQMALGWLLKDQRITSVLIGASSVEQFQDSLKGTQAQHFSEEELKQIEEILK
jgi:L-glyceraldehyde 3-phosphate reductase